jgi:toxin ParE1/3/4
LRVVLAGRAKSDRLSHYDYLSDFSVAAADRVDERIRASVAQIARFPHSGRSGRVKDSRELPVARTQLVLIYRVKSDHVRILRILHGAQDWPARF